MGDPRAARFVTGRDDRLVFHEGLLQMCCTIQSPVTCRVGTLRRFQRFAMAIVITSAPSSGSEWFILSRECFPRPPHQRSAIYSRCEIQNSLALREFGG